MNIQLALPYDEDREALEDAVAELKPTEHLLVDVWNAVQRVSAPIARRLVFTADVPLDVGPALELIRRLDAVGDAAVHCIVRGWEIEDPGWLEKAVLEYLRGESGGS